MAIGALLAIATAAAWLGSVGFLRLKSAYARQHCVAFVAIASGVSIAAACLLADGASDRAMKILLLLVIMLLAGGVLSHATGRAIALHDMNREKQ